MHFIAYARIYALCARVCVHVSLQKIFGSLSLKFYKDPSFCCRDICKKDTEICLILNIQCIIFTNIQIQALKHIEL